MKTICLCGSLKYMDDMIDIAQLLTIQGYCVITPCYPSKRVNVSSSDLVLFKEAHFKRIEYADIIYIVDINNYIGDSTKLEIEYATKLNKNIIYHSSNNIIDR